jgi:hypothetical protein
VIQACYAAQLSDAALDWLVNGGVIGHEQRGETTTDGPANAAEARIVEVLGACGNDIAEATDRLRERADAAVHAQTASMPRWHAFDAFRRQSVERLRRGKYVSGTVGSRPNFYVAGMAGERTVLAPMCPSCGKPIGLSRTIPASAGFRELQTFGCRDCGVWLTEDPLASKREDLKRAPITRHRN